MGAGAGLGAGTGDGATGVCMLFEPHAANSINTGKSARPVMVPQPHLYSAERKNRVPDRTSVGGDDSA